MNVATGGLRDQLLDHATAMLEAGDNEPGIRALARAAGVSAMAPYRHFADKAALLDAVAERGYALLAGQLTVADAQGNDRERVVAQGLAYVAFATAHPALFRLMFMRPCAEPATAAPDAPAFDILAQRIAALAGGAEAALGCWAIVHGLATLALDGRIVADETQMRAVLTLYVAGIGHAG